LQGKGIQLTSLLAFRFCLEQLIDVVMNRQDAVFAHAGCTVLNEDGEVLSFCDRKSQKHNEN